MRLLDDRIWHMNCTQRFYCAHPSLQHTPPHTSTGNRNLRWPRPTRNDNRANCQQPTSFHHLAPVLHVVIASYLELVDVLRVGTGARWSQESYKPQFTTNLFLVAHSVLNDTSRT